MVEPVAFGFNEETAANNYFQQRTVAAGETVQACALKEFRGMVDKLRANGIEVTSGAGYPDTSYSGFHISGTTGCPFTTTERWCCILCLRKTAGRKDGRISCSG